MCEVSQELRMAAHRTLDALLDKLAGTKTVIGEVDLALKNSFMLGEVLEQMDFHNEDLNIRDIYEAYAIEADSERGYDAITFRRQVIGGHEPSNAYGVVATSGFEYESD
jgi:hypothetical protein